MTVAFWSHALSVLSCRSVQSGLAMGPCMWMFVVCSLLCLKASTAEEVVASPLCNYSIEQLSCSLFIHLRFEPIHTCPNWQKGVLMYDWLDTCDIAFTTRVPLCHLYHLPVTKGSSVASSLPCIHLILKALAPSRFIFTNTLES